MHTQCPECNTVFRVTAEQLNAAGGRVRCGECHSIFNAQQHLFEQIPPRPQRQAVETPAEPAKSTAAGPAAATPLRDEFDALFGTGETAATAEPSSIDEMAGELDALLGAETEPTAAEAVDDTVADFDALFGTGEAAGAAEPTSIDETATELDALLGAETEPTAAEAVDDTVADFDALFGTEETSAETESAAAEDAAAGLDTFLAAEAEKETEPATSTDSSSAYDIDLDEFFSTPAEEAGTGESAAAAEQQERSAAPAAAIELDEFFEPSEDIEPTPTTQPTPRPPAGDDLFGEAQIESLLHPQDAESLELPWERAEEQPAVVVDLSEDSGTLLDEFADLNLETTGNAVDEFDLPEAQLTSAHTLGKEKPEMTRPLPELLASESDEPAHSLAGALGWTLGIVLLLTLLAAQYGYINRNPLVLRYPELRPALELACTYTGCQLPPRRDLGAITLLERDIRSHDSYQGALIITATLLNRADFAQPYPDVEVIMRDLGGNVVAARRFQPSQYLSGNYPTQFDPQATAQLLLEVSDPGAAAVGFEFNFY